MTAGWLVLIRVGLRCFPEMQHIHLTNELRSIDWEVRNFFWTLYNIPFHMYVLSWRSLWVSNCMLEKVMLQNMIWQLNFPPFFVSFFLECFYIFAFISNPGDLLIHTLVFIKWVLETDCFTRLERPPPLQGNGTRVDSWRSCPFAVLNGLTMMTRLMNCAWGKVLTSHDLLESR